MKDISEDPADNVLFHVGFHKTATTFLQNEFFNERFGFHNLLSADDVGELITDPLRFDFDPEEVKGAMRAQAGRSGLVNVVSREALCGHPFFGGREAPEFAERIKAVAPEAKILITIREQISIITSTYAQYVSRAGSLPIVDFLGENEYYGYYYFGHRHFLYDRLVSHYMELFGDDRVMVVTLESLARDRAAALAAIARFAGADPSAVAGAQFGPRVGESPADAFLPVLRRINHFRRGAAKREVVLDLGPVAESLYRLVNRAGRGKRIRSWLRGYAPVRRAVEERFSGRFGESNRRLQVLMGDRIDLARDGFEMAPAHLSLERISAT